MLSQVGKDAFGLALDIAVLKKHFVREIGSFFFSPGIVLDQLSSNWIIKRLISVPFFLSLASM